MPNSGHIILALLLLAMIVVIYLMAKRPEPFSCLVCADKVRDRSLSVAVQGLDDDEKLFLVGIHLCREHMALSDEELAMAFYEYTMLPNWVQIQILRKDNQA